MEETGVGTEINYILQIEEQANKFYKEDDYEQALHCYTVALKELPYKASLYISKGECLRKLERYDAALAFYEKALKIKPTSLAAHHGICNTYISMKNYRKAENILAKAFELNHQSSISYDCRGRILHLQLQYEAALEAFKQAIRLALNTENLAVYYYNKGSALSNLYRYDEALDAYYEAWQCGSKKLFSQELSVNFFKQNCSKKLSSIFDEGKKLLYTKNFVNALKIFEFLLLLQETFGPALIGKGDALLGLNCYEEAISLFNRALREFPDDTHTHTQKGKSLLCLKKYTEALREFETVISLWSNHPIALTGKGDALRGLNRCEDALETYQKALQLNPQLSLAWAGKGHALYTLDQRMEALKAYNYAIQHASEDTECYSNAGEILASLGDYEEAKEMYNQALVLTPDLISARLGLGNVLFTLKRYQEALATYQQVVAHDHNNIMAYVSIGNIQAIIQAETEATEAYERALELIQRASSHDFLWSLLTLANVYPRPAEIQFALLLQFILNAQQNTRVTEALDILGDLYKQLFDPQSVPSTKLQTNIGKLAQMLTRLRVEDRAEALVRITNNDINAAQMLILLESHALAGLDKLAYQLALRLKPEPCDGDLFDDFYLVLDRYRVPNEDVHWFYAQLLIAQMNYNEALPLLRGLVKQHPKLDKLWVLAETLNKLDAEPLDKLQTLLQFTNTACSSDERMGLAWERIGQLYEQQENHQAAIQAYKQADSAYKKSGQNECTALLLHMYRVGRWKDIQGLENEADFAFPPVIVIDLECERRLGSPLGSTVFEIGAVCMKGNTELATYEAVIQRDFVARKVKDRQHLAVPVEQVIAELRAFIEHSQQSLEKAIIVGHNFQAFDASHLRALGLPIADDQIIDTLTFARLLHPDSIHHNLSLLCERYNIDLEQAHNALPDTRACAQLLYALGEELVARGEHFLAGFRAFVPAESAFDRAVLQPRKCVASPACPWELSPAPAPVQVLSLYKNASPSPQLLHAIQTGDDALVERFDPYGAYASELPRDRKTAVTVATRDRLEQLLTAVRGRHDLFVLPDPHTLLCPHRLRESIEREEDPQIQLALFCLYQAAHNHDAGTLYPLRLYFKRENTSSPGEDTPNGDTFIQKLRQMLLEACCASDREHAAGCPAHQIAREASEKSTLLLATHENFLRQPRQLSSDLLIVDDIDDLQMHFAEYLANKVTAQELETHDKDIYNLLNVSLNEYVTRQPNRATLHEKLPLSRIVSHLTRPQNEQEKSVLDLLREQSRRGEIIAQTLAYFCNASTQQAKPGYVHAYWLDLVFSAEQTDSSKQLEHWGFYGINEDLRQAFLNFFWQPFRQHILCGTAIALGGAETQFLRRFFDIPTDVPFLADEKKAVQVYIPHKETIPPSSFLARRRWAESAGAFLYRLAHASHDSIVVTLHSSAILEALARVFNANWQSLQRRTLSPYLGWTITRINDYLCEENDHLPIAFLSPRQRKIALNNQVGIEVTGPLRFLNQQDPLVAAQMRAFVIQKDASKDGPFSAYLLPQALLELKARTSSQASLHIILDSALNHATYRDEVSSLFEQKVLNTLPVTLEDERLPFIFGNTLSNELAHKGFSAYLKVEDETLDEALHTYWGEEKHFRMPPVASLDQKAVIQRVFTQKDQLVIAATGGGKSLCFQLPAILLAQDIIPKVTLVISPLIALMQDQVEALNRRGIFSAISWSSNVSQIDKRAYLRGIKQGDYSIIYLAPEQVYSAALRDALRRREIGLIAIDEAHCVSQWGHNFRTAYFQLKDWIDTQICQNHERAFPLLALTATARGKYYAVQEKSIAENNGEISTIQDILEKLGLNQREEDVRLASPERPELRLLVERISVPCPYCGHKSHESGEVRCKNESCQERFSISEEQIRQSKMQKLIEFLRPYVEDGLDTTENQISIRMPQRGIIYCRTTLETERVCTDIQQAFSSSLRIAYYHGKIKEGREEISRRFISDGDDRLDIIVATNAFGMGIDARLLGFVVHFDVPSTLEAYYQEAGRAGRDDLFTDENRAQCMLLYHANDLEGQRWLTSRNSIKDQDIELVYKMLTQIKGSRRSEIMVKASQIQGLTDLDENKIDPILYYLERHTTAYDKQVLKRRENSTQLWQLKFAPGYQECLTDPHLSSLSRQLADAFCHSQPFLLNEEHTVIIDIEALAAFLEREQHIIDAEKQNLVRRRIIVDADEAYVQWQKTQDECTRCIKQLKKGIVVLLNSVVNQKALRAGEQVTVSIQALYMSGKLSTIDLPESMFIAFLDALSKDDAGDLQLFSTFKALTLQGSSKLCLRISPDETPTARIKNILQRLPQQLSQVVERFGYESINADEKRQRDSTRYINLLDVAPDSLERKQLEQALRLLQTVGLLNLLEGKQRETVMRITFLQQEVSAHELKIDLRTLRLVERYGKRKLDLMHEYAISAEEERKQLLHDYFFGSKPLIEPFAPDPVLTKEQSELVTLSDGYHLIQAPAGSGKSFVLQEHFRYLVEHLQVPSDCILVTAQQHGAINRLGNRLEDTRNTNRSIPTKTLQTLAAGIFKSEQNRLMGVDKRPYFFADKEIRLLKGKQSDRERDLEIVSFALKRLHSHREIISLYLPDGMEFPQLPENYQPNYKEEERYYKAIGSFRSWGIFPPHISTRDEIEVPLQSLIKESYWLRSHLTVCYAVYISYQLLQRELSLYTFDDQILFALAILRAYPEIAEQWQRKYEHIIIDEFQDLTPARAALIGQISHKHRNVLAVGDGTQRINMDFDNEVGLAATFRLIDEDIRVDQHSLTTNFRSVQEILDFAQSISGLPPLYAQKQISAHGKKGCKPKIVCLNRNAVVIPGERGTIQAMVDVALYYREQLPPKDAGSVALLVAKANLGNTIHDYLQQKNHPFTILEYQHRYQSESAKRYLAYLRLIQDCNQADMVEFLLQRCLSPYFTVNQVARLKTRAAQLSQTLLETARDPAIHQEIKANVELLPTLQKHIQLIQRYTSDSLCEQIWPSIRELLQTADGQQSEEIEQDEASTSEGGELEEMLKDLGKKTVQQALEHVDHFITFIEENRSKQKLVVATIDNAKSQDFDTVFLIGADQLKEKRRWYVSITRARQRFFALVEDVAFISSHQILREISKQYYDVLHFPDDL